MEHGELEGGADVGAGAGGDMIVALPSDDEGVVAPPAPAMPLPAAGAIVGNMHAHDNGSILIVRDPASDQWYLENRRTHEVVRLISPPHGCEWRLSFSDSFGYVDGGCESHWVNSHDDNSCSDVGSDDADDNADDDDGDLDDEIGGVLY